MTLVSGPRWQASILSSSRASGQLPTWEKVWGPGLHPSSTSGNSGRRPASCCALTAFVVFGPRTRRRVSCAALLVRPGVKPFPQCILQAHPGFEDGTMLPSAPYHPPFELFLGSFNVC